MKSKMNNNIKKNFKLLPDEYRKILDKIELLDLNLIKTDASCDKSIVTGSKINVKTKFNSEYKVLDENITVICNYNLKATTANNKTLLNINAKYEIVFNNTAGFNDDFFEIYSEISLPVILWPFFRELVYSISSRMNIHPLVLPMIKR